MLQTIMCKKYLFESKILRNLSPFSRLCSTFEVKSLSVMTSLLHVEELFSWCTTSLLQSGYHQNHEWTHYFHQNTLFICQYKWSVFTSLHGNSPFEVNDLAVPGTYQRAADILLEGYLMIYNIYTTETYNGTRTTHHLWMTCWKVTSVLSVRHIKDNKLHSELSCREPSNTQWKQLSILRLVNGTKINEEALLSATYYLQGLTFISLEAILCHTFQ